MTARPSSSRLRSLLFLLAGPLVTAIAPVPLTAAEPADSFPVEITLDPDQSLGPWKPIWRFFGADEPNYATMPHGRALLGELGGLKPDAVYFRTHNLLTSGDGTPALKWGSTGVYGEDGQGRPIYDWTILDGIFDAYRTSHVRPYVQIGFMPEALSVKPVPYRHHWHPGAKYDEIYTGWAYPPKDWQKWAELIHQWTLHHIGRYGREEVATWHYHDDDLPGPAASVTLPFSGLPLQARRMRHWTIDELHSNVWSAWRAMGSPQTPTDAQIADLKTVGALTEAPLPKSIRDREGQSVLVTLPRQAVSLLTFD